MMTWKPSGFVYINYLFLNVNFFNFPSSQSVINTCSTSREGYISLIKGYFPDADLQCVRLVNSKWEFFLGVPHSIYYFLKAVLFSVNIRCSIGERVKLVVALSLGFKVIDKLEQQVIECDKYIAFNSSYLLESFLSYYFRLRNVDTYSLQHGMYFSYCNEIPYDVINYENVCAEKLLVWGRYSINEIQDKIPLSSRCLLFGYPESYYPKDLTQKKSEKILVLLPRDIYLSDIRVLLEYLGECQFNFLIRPHPSVAEEVEVLISTKDNFRLDKSPLLHSTLKSELFKGVIAFNSTAVFEAKLYNQKVLMFKSSSTEFINPGFVEFCIGEDLADVLVKESSLVKDDFFVPQVFSIQ